MKSCWRGEESDVERGNAFGGVVGVVGLVESLSTSHEDGEGERPPRRLLHRKKRRFDSYMPMTYNRSKDSAS